MTEKRYLKWYNKVGYGSGDIAGNVLNAHASFRTYASREEYRTPRFRPRRHVSAQSLS